ncbi:MarR family transcriptional regulator [uncultured Intestinimonas sp.]|uniref:MarR family winged helix-turn-helix transcriptional regulator n=1 Tax=uncultured Intestinimonas sp. TaxID=1689265 RepID=UPI0025CC334D|nr:MarR family transcriptional regulator [uncultured Intestinimonas sp.]
MEDSLHILLYRAFHAQRNLLRPSLVELGLGSGQPKLLAYLAAHGPCCQKELADYFDVDPANVSRMMESLERGGFVTRQADQQNRRRDLAEITDRGRQAGARWRSRYREVEERMLRDFSPEERERFKAYLVRAYRNAREEMRGEKTWES